MLEINISFIEKHRDILSFRDLAPNTVATYCSYLKTYIEWVEANLPGRDCIFHPRSPLFTAV